MNYRFSLVAIYTLIFSILLSSDNNFSYFENSSNGMLNLSQDPEFEDIDGVHSVFDGTPIDNDIQNKIDYSKSLVFKDFKIYTDPMIYEFSDIDYPPSHNPVTRGAEADYFSLFYHKGLNVY